MSDETILIPTKDDAFVPFGNYEHVETIVKSKVFYPFVISGPSGNGKTYGVEQACANSGRELIRVNLTIETDEDDLIGGFRLVNSETVFVKGPVIRAMEAGAVLLLDEFDLANPAKIMCLQSILEGSGYFIKKTGEIVKPAEGFTIIATANTKGQGSDDGRWVGTNIMNEAFLERFCATYDQEYPDRSVEVEILEKTYKKIPFKNSNINPDFLSVFFASLTKWASATRKTAEATGDGEFITTRRLIHITKTFAIFNDYEKSIKDCIGRFDAEISDAFWKLFQKLVDDKFDNLANGLSAKELAKIQKKEERLAKEKRIAEEKRLAEEKLAAEEDQKQNIAKVAKTLATNTSSKTTTNTSLSSSYDEKSLNNEDFDDLIPW